MIRAFQWDLARQVERLDVLLRLLPHYAQWGYGELYLHLEDAVHYPSLPGIGRTDAYRPEEVLRLVTAAGDAGIRVVPIVNLLGHTQYLIKHPDLRELNELRDAAGDPLVSGQVCPLHPRFPEVARKLLADAKPFCTAGKVHVGLDESFHLGKCPRCRAEVDRIGLAAHFAGHVRRLHGLAADLGLTLGMWADMLYFVPEAIPLLPRGITAYDWYYYPFARVPRVEFFNFAERDLHPALARQGIAYYGCPMNGAFRYEPMPVFGERLANIRSWWARCRAVKADGLLVTSWEAYRLALETTTVVDAAAAGLWQAPEEDDATSLLARGLAAAMQAKQPRQQARALLAADEFAFAGYTRWEINERWEIGSTTDSIKPYLRELHHCQRLAQRSTDWHPALAASLRFRRYLAARDVFVRQAARDVFRCRRHWRKQHLPALRELLAEMAGQARAFAAAWRDGRDAARAMWRQTRDPKWSSQNEALLARDAERLAAWRRCLKGLGAQPEKVFGATPVCGAWQLQFVVHNFAPAVARVAVEQQSSDGTWREIASRYTIEFRAAAARPQARIRREFTAPVGSPDARLRLRVGGVGQVGVSHPTLTDGVQSLQDVRWRMRRILGQPAPQNGLPDPTQRSEPLDLDFRRA